MKIALVFIFFAVGLLGVYYLVSWYSRFIYKTLVTDKLSDIDEILETREIPANWKNPFLIKLIQRTDGTVFFTVAGFILKKRYTRKLIHLIDYIQHSTYLAQEDKESFTQELEMVLVEWKGRNIKQLL